MTRLNWSAAGERFYETGMDRGVLYVGHGSGVAWTGLISVSEESSGGEPKPYYIDGVKFLNVSAAEDFEATINAFNSPSEFGVCDGIAAIQNGLFVTQQPRKFFGLSYRTIVGNDTEGTEHGYKLHLIYGALAAPTTRSNTTLGSSVEPTSFSWKLTTLPPALSGHKPTAHLVIDSRITPKGLLEHVEDIIYGSDVTVPRLPTPQELKTLFGTEGPVLRENYVFDPSMKVASGTVEIARNYVRDPNLKAVTDWVTTGTGSVRVIETLAAWAGGTALKFTAGTSAPDPAYGYATYVNPIAVALPTGSKLMWRIKLQAPVARTLTVWPVVSGSTLTPRTVTLVANVPQEIVIESTSTAPVTNLYVIIGTTVASAVFYVDTLYIGRPVTAYFDGATPAAGDFSYSWTGTVNLSQSVTTGKQISNGLIVYAHQSAADGYGGFYAEVRNSAISYTQASPGVIGQYWAARFILAPAPDTPAGSTVRLTIHDGTTHVAFTSLEGAATPYIPIPLVPTEMVLYSSVPLTNTAPRFYVYPGNEATPVRVARLLMDKVSGPNLAPGPYFDGGTPDANGYFHSWSGLANASKSVLNSWHLS